MKKKSIISLCIVILAAVLLNYVGFFGYSLGTHKYGGVFYEEKIDEATGAVIDDTKGGIKKGIDLAGGSVITFQAEKENPSDAEMDIAEAIFDTRLQSAGYTEARISRDDSGKITVEIPSVFDTDSAANILGKVAELTFTDADGNVVLDGATDVKNAEAKYGQTSENGPASSYVELTFNQPAVAKFADATRAAAARAEGENYIAIKLDEEVVSQPRVSEEINSDTCVISGSFTQAEAQELANLIKSGQLPFALTKISQETVGAELGDDALPKSLQAAAIGIILIMLFMIFMYRLPGFLADIALAVYIGIMVLILGLFRINLSLSGIAGIVLSIGMAVDANCIIFERIKEEMAIGKTIKASVEAGFNKAFSAILDSNITTIITCIVLYMSGVGAVTGFAITLGIGVVVSMFTAIVVTKMLLKSMVGLGLKSRKLICSQKKKGGAAE